jgi:hypothetical protein
MANTKISALPASTTPLAGTEVLPIVQSSATKKVSVADLTAGRAISATQLTLTTGNLIVADGQGIDFSATPGTGTSELLADYEEGTWTPSIGGTATYFAQTGRYTRVGRLVTFTGTIYINFLNTGSLTTISGLPFTASQRSAICFGQFDFLGTAVSSLYGLINSGATTISLRGITAAAASNSSITTFGNQTYIDFSGQYTV